ncbi:MAG: SoxR reducing system RseC family protein [Sedimentibacter sp.]
MDQVGKIEKIDGHKATISVRRPHGCGPNCASCGGSCKVNSVFFETEITSEYKEGEFVEITTESEVVFKQIFVLYGVPFLLMVSTIAIVQLLLDTSNKDVISAVASLASLVVSYFILKAYDKREMKKNTLKFTVGKKLYQ